MQYDVIKKDGKSYVLKGGIQITDGLPDYNANTIQKDLSYLVNSGDPILFIEDSDVRSIRLYLKEAYRAGYTIKTHTTTIYDSMLFHSFTLEKKGN